MYIRLAFCFAYLKDLKLFTSTYVIVLHLYW